MTAPNSLTRSVVNSDNPEMPIPLVFWGVGSALSAAVLWWRRKDVAAVGQLVAEKTVNIYAASMEYFLSCRAVAVLGARGVGKTTLMTFIAEGKIVRDYKPTRAPDATDWTSTLTTQGKLSIRRGLDLSGDQFAINQWEDAWKTVSKEGGKQGIVLYCVRADLFVQTDPDAAHVDRVNQDIERMLAWSKADAIGHFVVVATHADLIPGWLLNAEGIAAAKLHDDIVRAVEKSCAVRTVDGYRTTLVCSLCTDVGFEDVLNGIVATVKQSR